ncbi:MAG: L-2-amino-thiazoline-4-carboxylic acid hydrolase [Leptospirales bacterium]
MKKNKNTPTGFSFGVKLLLAYMKRDLALYKAMIKNNIEVEIAQKHIEEIGWTIFKNISVFSYKLTRLIGSNRKRRLGLVNGLLWFIIFRKPFQRVKKDGECDVGFDVVKCPISNFFIENESPELTAFAACNMDYPLAELWHCNLKRTQTISKGGDSCDFRFHLKSR